MTDEHYMHRCLQLAALGLGNVSPNPLVGCVIVHDSKIIGEGYHKKFGGYHAEVMAINSVKEKNLLDYSTLFVSLEPCSHFGKTPPCTDLILKHKIPNVVIGTSDPFEKVNGSGIKKLKEAGVNIKSLVLETECMSLNKRFFTFHIKKRPYIILKWAETADRFIAPLINQKNKIHWISNKLSRTLVHKWRSEESAILTGTNTAMADDPQLTNRVWPGNNPLRIVIDKELKLPDKLHLFNHKAPTIVVTSRKKKPSLNLEYIQIDFNENVIEQILNALYRRNIQSLIVEGGTKLLNSFIDLNLWDEARVFTGSSFLNEGITAPDLKRNALSVQKIDSDKLSIYLN